MNIIDSQSAGKRFIRTKTVSDVPSEFTDKEAMEKLESARRIHSLAYGR
jgi:hypothetical protein